MTRRVPVPLAVSRGRAHNEGALARLASDLLQPLARMGARANGLARQVTEGTPDGDTLVSELRAIEEETELLARRIATFIDVRAARRERRRRRT